VLAGRIDRAIAFGASQSGRYLHDFLYYGFNADEAGKPVFEGLMPHLAGGKKTTPISASASRRSPISMPHAVSGGVSLHLSRNTMR